MTRIVKMIAILLLAIPIALALVIFTAPFWRWFEVSTGIESIGHSGPAAWCYVFVYVMLVLLGVLYWALPGKGNDRGI
jgi:hypothetical protein